MAKTKRERALEKRGYDLIFMNFKNKRSAEADAAWFRRNRWKSVAVIQRTAKHFLILAKGKRKKRR